MYGTDGCEGLHVYVIVLSHVSRICRSMHVRNCVVVTDCMCVEWSCTAPRLMACLMAGLLLARLTFTHACLLPYLCMRRTGEVTRHPRRRRRTCSNSSSSSNNTSPATPVRAPAPRLWARRQRRRWSATAQPHQEPARPLQGLLQSWAAAAAACTQPPEPAGLLPEV